MAGQRTNEFGEGMSSVIKKVMMEDVAPTVQEILKKHIEQDIYNAYTPKEGAWVDGETYQRRHVLEQHITSEMIDDKTLLVTSDTAANDPIVPGYEFSNNYPGAFLELLESGHTGIWKSGFARPAVKNAQDEVDHMGSIQTMIRNKVKQALNGGTNG